RCTPASHGASVQPASPSEASQKGGPIQAATTRNPVRSSLQACNTPASVHSYSPEVHAGSAHAGAPATALPAKLTWHKAALAQVATASNPVCPALQVSKSAPSQRSSPG